MRRAGTSTRNTSIPCGWPTKSPPSAGRWVFDINFQPTLRAIADRGYLDTIAAALPATPRVEQVLCKARRHLAATLAGGT